MTQELVSLLSLHSCVRSKLTHALTHTENSQTHFRIFVVYNPRDTTIYHQICISETVVQGFNNPGAFSSSAPKERKFESG
jgi:hypothetical protein